jgi:hypothetical protein
MWISSVEGCDSGSRPVIDRCAEVKQNAVAVAWRLAEDGATFGHDHLAAGRLALPRDIRNNRFIASPVSAR